MSAPQTFSPLGVPPRTGCPWWHPAGAPGATLWFAFATLVWSWPLPVRMGRDVPWDLGDSLLNCWILGWNADHLLRFLGGDGSALATLWHGNIFHPAPYVLGYSELLLAQSVQVLPVYAISGNLLLCYNLLFLSTFVLSGLGMYVLVRDLTGDWRAALIAGTVFAFVPYRAAQATHVQILSTQWMPFVLVGLRRYLVSGRWRPLAAATAALVAHNLSCGYFMIFFALFLPFYVLYELADRGQLGNIRRWAGLGAMVLVSAAATLPAMTPYLALRARDAGPRPLSEVEYYSADVFSYFTAPDNVHLWGRLMRVFDKPEGQLFPGLLALALGAVAAWRLVRRADALAAPSARPHLVRALTVLVAASLALSVAVLFQLATEVSIGPLVLRFRSMGRLLALAALASVALAWYSPAFRARLRGQPGSLLGFALVAMAAAAWLSLGPEPKSMGRELAVPTIYGWLFDHLPGFDSLRVAARFGMLTIFFLAIAAGYGAAAVLGRRRFATAASLVMAAFAVTESMATPIPLNVSWSEHLATPPARVNPTTNPPQVYRHIGTLPADAVIVELPFGDAGWELRYVYYSTTHWRRLLNGYSGGFPPEYIAYRAVLGGIPDREDAWSMLERAGVTHVVVHERGFAAGRGAETRAWLEAHGAEQLGAYGREFLYRLPPR